MSAIRAATIAGTVLACLLAAVVTRAAEALPDGTQEVQFDFGGHRRFFLMHVPPQAAAGRPLPVVLSFHGGGGEPRAQEQWTAMDALGDREGFIVIYPAGYARTGSPGRMLLTWNSGGCCGPAMDDGSDDVGFVRQVLIAANARAPLDVTRIYATGMSNGAMMSYRLARELSPQIAAIAPVSGASDAPIPADTLPTPVLHIHSVDDPRAPYAGGEGPPFPFTERRVDHPPVEKVVGAWAAHDGCPPVPAAEATRTNAAGHTATRLTYGPCSSGKPVVLWRLTGSGHVWPGAPQKHSTKLLGTATDVIDADTEIWTFFRQFRRPDAPPLPAALPQAASAPPSPQTSKASDGELRPELELPFSRSVLVLRAVGARDRFRDDDTTTRAGTLSLQARTTLMGRLRLEGQGLRASALMVGLDGRAFTTNLPVVADDDRFYRLGASLSGFLLTPGRHFYWAQLGAFVAEQGRLLDDPKLRLYAMGLGTVPAGARTQLIYGLGYVYDFGRGLPLPFLGIAWHGSPNVRLDVLLPLLARLTWRTSAALAVTFGTHVAGDIYRYQGTDASGTPQLRQLRIARLRAGVGARYAVAARARLEFELGVEGAQVQDDVTTRRADGGYLLGALVLGKGYERGEESLAEE